MIPLPALLDVNTVFFTVLNYPMSYIEFFGTLANIWSVWLISKRNILSWPVGIVAVVLFMILFYQIQLYSDFLEQVYFLITSFIGWWVWYKHPTSQQESGQEITVVALNQRQNVIWIINTVLATIILWYITVQLPVLLPAIFTAPPSFPWLDAFTTAMSFVATYLMIQKQISCWYYWIAVDIIGIGLYYAKDVKFLAVLYAIFLILAVKGLLAWKQSARNQLVVSAA